MRVIAAPAHGGKAAATRMLLLPGAYQEPEDFLQAGFADAVAQRALALDLYFIAPQPRHLTDREPLQTIHRQLIQPARAAGQRVWMLGISFGGLLALLYAQRHPQTLEGLCLLAPYLGSRALELEIEQAGGLSRWSQSPAAMGPGAADEEARTAWCFLQQRAADGLVRFLGTGREDRFAAAHRLAAAVLPSAHADVIPGGHDWRTWRQLWDNFLDQEHMLWP